MNNGKICVSVCAETANEFVEKIERAAELADVIELRFDCLKDEAETLWQELKSIRQKNKVKLLATFRPQIQGGKRNITLEERKDFWHDSHVYEFVDWGDFEFDLQTDNWDSYFRGVFKRIIRSFHDFSGVPDNLVDIYDNLVQATDYIRLVGGQKDVVKIAIQTTDSMDSLAVMKLLERAKSENKELIPIAMGEYGIWTRILGLSRGAFMTFASLDDASATAPGQLTADEMINVYRVKELDENTEIYGLVAGSTVHSVSPQMHNAAFKFHGRDAVYVPFAVKNLEEFIRRMVNPKTREIDWKLQGLSITIPHKIEIIKYLDLVDEVALKIGAVNTVKIVGDKLHGFNTDAIGFIEPLKNSYGDLRNAKVAVLGAGGAARAIVYALKKEQANVTVFARNVEKARTLEHDFGIKADELKNYPRRATNYDLVVNATPLGMKKGGLENETPLKAEQLEGVGLIYDLVYNPFETRLIKEAQTVFVPTLGGLAMLVGQAIEQQKIWTGKDAPAKEMTQAALKKL